MKISRLSAFVSALALLGGCVAVPVDPGYYAGSPDYYGPAPVFIAPPAVYFGRRIHVWPHTGSGAHGGKRGFDRGSDRGSGRGSGRGHRRR